MDLDGLGERVPRLALRSPVSMNCPAATSSAFALRRRPPGFVHNAPRPRAAGASWSSKPRGTSPRKSWTIVVRQAIRGRLADPQPVEERQQRQRLAQLVAGTPEHLAAGLRRFCHRRPHQRGLADARFALTEHRTAASQGHLSYEPRSVVISLSRPTSASAAVTRGHGTNLTTRIFTEQSDLILYTYSAPGALSSGNIAMFPASCSANSIEPCTAWKANIFPI